MPQNNYFYNRLILKTTFHAKMAENCVFSLSDTEVCFFKTRHLKTSPWTLTKPGGYSQFFWHFLKLCQYNKIVRLILIMV